MSKRTIGFVATVAMAVTTACAAPTDALDGSERFGATSAALEVGPRSVPYPVASLGGNIQYDANGHALPKWSGTLVDLMAADAWAQCAAHVRSAAQHPTDAYQAHLEHHITQSECPGASSQTLPPSEFTIDGCAGTCSSAVKRWARQRQIDWCNVDTSTGLPSTVHFYGNQSVGHTLAASSFTALAATASSPSVLDGAIASAQKEVDIAEVNLCMGQRLRENIASADSLFLSADDLRQLLEVVRQRAQLAIVQYGLLARTFTNPDDRSGGPSSPYQAFITLMHWSKRPEAETPMREMGEDLAAAVQLHIDTTRELAQVLNRSASGRIGRGGTPTSNAQTDFGAGSWRQRLLALLYGGNPSTGTDTTAEIDLSKTPDIEAVEQMFQAGAASAVPWETAWTEDSLDDWRWPNAAAPITPWQKYAVTSTSDPHIRQFLALAREADALFLKEAPADFPVVGGTWSFRRVDTESSAPQVWALVEAWLRTQECKKTNPSCSVGVSDPTMPGPAVYASSLLWKKYGIHPMHAVTLVSMLADVAPVLGESNPRYNPLSSSPPSVPVEVQGAMHVTGASRTLTSGEISARMPGQTGTWYRLDPSFDVLPLGNPERAPLYTYVAPYFLPRSFDKYNVPNSQGFGHGDAVKRLGAISALGAIRNLLEDAVGGANATIKATYLAKVPRVLSLISSAIGERSMSVRPSTSVKTLYRYCDDFDPPPLTLKACPTIAQTAAPDGTTARWNISVRTQAADPFFENAVSLVIVPFQGGIESAAALDPAYSSFKGATRASLLQSTARVEVVLPAPTPLEAGGQQRDVTVDLATMTSASVIPRTGSGRAFSVFLKRTRTDGETEYQLLAQRLVLATDIRTRPTGTGGTSEVVGLPIDGQFIAYGGVLGQMAARAWVTRADEWSKPAYDAFDLPTDWVPPFDPSLFTGGTEDAAVTYLRNARVAADEATNAVKNAIEELLKQQADDATLATAQRRAAEIVQLEQRALCGEANPDCDTSTIDFPMKGYVSAPDCAAGTALCEPAKDLFARSVPQSVRLARAVHDHRNDQAPPAFNEYAGGTLQKALIQQWTALRKLKQLGDETQSGVASHHDQINVASAELAQANGVQAYECGSAAMNDAYYSGFSYPAKRIGFGPPENGYFQPHGTQPVGWSPGPYVAQKKACERAQLSMGPLTARWGAVVSQAYAWMAAQTTLVLEAGSALQLASAELAKVRAETNLAKASAQVEASLARGTLVTKFGTYRRYHSYDMWRARALLESTRRYAVAARRAIEARYVVDLSEMRSDEPFVAAPATWADEIYEYDLAAPASVGLAAIPQNRTGIYPNRLVDYVGNLERFVNGYAVARPTAVAQNDDDLFHVSGPDSRLDQTVNGKRALSGDVSAWEFLCPNATSWVQHPGLQPATANEPISTLCGGASPRRARVSFSLDAWGRLYGDIADEPYAKRHNARWLQLAVNLVGTGVRDCALSPDPNGCYANAYLRYNLTHVGRAWLTDYDEQWRSLGVAAGAIEGAKALAAEQWLDSTGNGFSKSYVANVARTEFAGRPIGGTYRLELEVTPDVRLDRIERVQVLARSSYWVKQGQSDPPPPSSEPLWLNYDLADTAGGDSITITGSNLGGASSCSVGGTAAAITANTATSLTFVMPAKAAGMHNVQVTLPSGTTNPLTIEAWSPSMIAGIDGYFDSRKGIALSGSTVTAWQEQTRGEVYAAVNAPTRIADTFLPGVPAVRYGPVNDRHSGNVRNLPGSNSVFWVGKWTGNSTARAPAACARNVVSNSSGYNGWGMYGDGLDLYTWSGGAAQFGTRGSALNSGSVFLVGLTHAGGTGKAYLGTTQLGADVAIGYSGSPSWSTIGSAAFYGAKGADADIGAVIVVAGVISPSDLAKLHKWARVGFGAAP